MKRLTDEYDNWFRQAFTLHALGEDISWEIIFAVRPNEQGQLSPWLFLYSHINSPVLGAKGVIMNLAEIPALSITTEVAERYVKDIVASLLKSRSEALALGNGHARPVPGKLVLPGS